MKKERLVLKQEPNTGSWWHQGLHSMLNVPPKGLINMTPNAFRNDWAASFQGCILVRLTNLTPISWVSGMG